MQQQLSLLWLFDYLTIPAAGGPCYLMQPCSRLMCSAGLNVACYLRRPLKAPHVVANNNLTDLFAPKVEVGQPLARDGVPGHSNAPPDSSCRAWLATTLRRMLLLHADALLNTSCRRAWVAALLCRVPPLRHVALPRTGCRHAWLS